MPHKFGRKPRAHDPRVPKWERLRAEKPRLALPLAVDNSTALPQTGLGMYLNDALGDCTCAAVYHALQVWSSAATPPTDNQPEANCLALYEQACGYVPSEPWTDQGGVEQSVLGYWVQPGAPYGIDGRERQNLAAFVEVNPTNFYDLKEAIVEGGVLYIGMQIPAYLDDNAPVWNVNPAGNGAIIGGHAVAVVGYNDATQQFQFISWGQKYAMTYAFWSTYVDEAYFLANREWIKATGVSPAGLTLAELEASMATLTKRHGHRRRMRRIKHRWDPAA